MSKSSAPSAFAVLVVACVLAVPAWATQPKEPVRNLDFKAFFLPELYISSSHADLEEVIAALPNREAWESFLAGPREGFANPAELKVWIDPRSGAATNILGAYPLIPGSGVGNRLTTDGLRLGALRAEGVDARVVAAAVRGFIEQNAALIGIDVAQLGEARVTQVNPDLWQVYIPQVYQGIPVRHGHLVASISHGNLVTIGTETWGNVAALSAQPELPAEAALHAGFAFADGPAAEDVILQPARLEVVPVAPELQAAGAAAEAARPGYRHRLVWSFVFQRPPEGAQWEVLVDAHTGDVIALQDKNQYVERTFKGGVYPLTSTEICPNADQCGTMQTSWPMPWAPTGLASPNNYTNSGGVFQWTSGNVTTSFNGRYVRMSDSCGTASATSSTGDINLGGTNGQHDCTTPGSGGAGNTAASRSGFYELNKLAEQARGWLPSNTWLQNQLTANMNLTQTCNAFWNGSTVNFYRSGGGCRNTGELAAVFDHEWGHGLDDFDANGSLSSSSEAYADIAAIYRLEASCVGHGFFWTINDGCGQTADGTGFNTNEALTGAAYCATDCSGVRDTDYAKHNPATPATALGFVCGQCTTGPGPCGRQVHCSAAPVRQAAWDLVARDLIGAPFSLDSQSAFIVGNRLFYQGSGNVGAWHACTCGSSSSGCGATNGYMQWITADDDNGNLNDGTPHMTAIHAAYNRHGVACATPTPTNSGCASGPSTAPTLTATAGPWQVALSWSSVAGATRYWVFRTEGHAGCNMGKALIADVTGTSYTDTQVAAGRTYYYNVVARGSSASCYTRVSTCQSATPAVGTPTPDFSISCSPSSLTVTQGGTSNASTCTVTSTNGFSSAVSLSCTGMPSGSTCSFSPASVTPPANGTASSTLTVSATASASTGSFSFNAQGVSGSTTRTFGMGLTVNPAGGGSDLFATFDAARQAPSCTTVGRSCDSGASLLLGRANLGPEPNQPNTINDSCADGTSGAFHSDESNDRIKVSTTDGTNFAPGKTVTIAATVWAWSTPSSDAADFFYAADATNPAWTLIGTTVPTVAGAQTLSRTYTLPSGALQAVRVQFRYQSTSAACSAGAYNDRDDLVFAVTSAPVTTVFFDNFETSLGWTRNLNGTDTATAGLWERGDPEQATSGATVTQLGTTVSGVNDLVTGRLFGGAAGTHDVDGGVTTITSPAITLPSTGTLTLSFSYYMAHLNNSSSADFLRVYVVGSTTTQVFQEVGAANNDAAAWATTSANISSFAGQTVRIRVEAADASTASLVEAAIDDVRITQQ
jgi:hypothetical protein